MSTAILSTHALRRVCLLLIVVSLLASAGALFLRIRAERSSRAVDVVLDYHELVGLAGLHGLQVEEVLSRMRAAGATAVALPEETLESLERQGRLALEPWSPNAFGHIAHLFMSGPEYALRARQQPVLLVRATDPAVADFVYAGLARSYSPANLLRRSSAEELLVVGERELVSDRGLGLYPPTVRRIQAAGLRVMPRLRSGSGFTDAQLTASLAAAAATLGAPVRGGARGVVVFDGDMLPGYRDYMPLLAEELTRHGLVYGAVEFAKQKGDAQLGQALDGRLVRVHSISLGELATLSPGQVLDRFVLAVKDRNIRLLYVHLPPLASDDALVAAGDYVKALADEIRAAGFVVAASSPAHPFTPFTVPWPVRALIFLGGGAGLLGWLLQLLPGRLPVVGLRRLWAVLAIGLLGAIGAAAVVPSLGRQVFGLLAAVSFPLLSLTWAYGQLAALAAARPPQALARGIRLLLTATMISLIGGLLVAAMMADAKLLVKVGQFAGVKLALVVPLLGIIGLVLIGGPALPTEELSAFVARARARVQATLAQPVYLWGILAGVVALLVLLLVLVRSGNDAPSAVSGVELQIRALLEQGLVARPRTKEFLIGHPALILAAVVAARGGWGPALVLLVIGGIGQVDVVNTYCHAHTPVILSLLRTANGLWVGILLTCLGWALWCWQGGMRATPGKMPAERGQ
jgi:hypothetical protein